MYNLKKNYGITLIALVITIVILLILAGITINLILGPNSIFNNAKEAKEQTAIAQAREKLEVVLNGAKIEKMTNSKYDLNKYISDNIQNVEINDSDNTIAVDGYIFKIDRSALEIIAYIGPVNGIVITATISGNDGWVKESEGRVIITGEIKAYSDGNITNVSASKNGTPILGFSINEDGSYTIEVTENATIIISAEDNKGEKNSKTIPVEIKIDNIQPTLDTVTALGEAMTIKVSATGTDNESGIKHFNYKISPENGIATDKIEGTFLPEETIEIVSTAEKTYTVTVTAIDNCDNISTSKSEEVTTINGLTVAQAKSIINETNLKNYMGMKVTDYSPSGGGTWRVFYYDKDGYFGSANTVYLKSDPLSSFHIYKVYDGYYTYTDDGLAILRRINPLWGGELSQNEGTNARCNQMSASWLCDPALWNHCKTDDSSFVSLAPSVEMFIKAYNVYKGEEILKCSIQNNDGYAISYNGSDFSDIVNLPVEDGPQGLFRAKEESYNWLASPSTNNSNTYILCFSSNYLGIR